MEWLGLVLVLLIVVLAPLVGLIWWQRRPRLAALKEPPRPAEPPTISWSEVRPGDRIIWLGSVLTVEAIVDCREERDDRVLGWSWLLLTDGGLLEYRGSRLTLFAAPAIVSLEAPEFEQLASPTGALAKFESRGRLSWDPVTFTWNGLAYEITGTGTFYGWSEANLADRPIWPGLSENPKENIYFALERTEPGPDGAAPDDLLVGIWTDQIGLYQCRRIGASAEATISRPHFEEKVRPNP